MLIPALFLVIGLVILTGGAELLVRSASGIALRFGISPLVVGLTVVAFGTSAPELAVSVRSALAGSSDIAAGNIVGSNIFNIAAILGLSALLCPLSVHLQVLRRDMPIMLATTVLGVVFFITGGTLERWEGAILFAGIVGYTVFSIRMARKETLELDAIPEPVKASLGLQCLLILVALGLLVGGAQMLVANAVRIAQLLGVSDAVIGLTVVAAGTSLPELATSVVAAFRKQTDIAVGNIVGSNIFNVLSIGGLAGMIAPIHAAGVTPVDYGFMLGASLLLLPFMRSGFQLSRWEGAVLLAGYGAYLYCVWPT